MTFRNPPNLVIDNKLNIPQAIAYQREWAKLINTNDVKGKIETIAGIDLAYDVLTNRAFAIAVVIDASSFAILEVKQATTDVQIPYRSGFLSFREVPAACMAVDQLSTKPDLIVCDGQGLAHPRRLGIACHLGLIYNIPTIGCGKSKLFGSAEPPGEMRGDFSYLYDRQKNIIGCVLRTRNHVSPVYVSVGNNISLKSACDWVLKLSPKYRLPITTRLADKLAHDYKISNVVHKT